MEFLATFFGTICASIFGSNIVLLGKSDYSFLRMKENKTKKFLFLLCFYLIEAIALGFVAFGVAKLAAKVEMIRYLSIVIFALVIGLFVLGGYILTDKVEKFKELKPMLIPALLNSSLLAVALTIFSLSEPSVALLIGNCLGLPLGYVLSFFVFTPIAVRIEESTAPKGFKTVPLILVSTALFILGFAMLTKFNF